METTGVIFDFNGTLFHDSDKQEKAWRDFAKQQFKREISDEEFRKHIHGRNNGYVLCYLSGRQLTEEQIDMFVEQKESGYRSLCRKDPIHFQLAPGAEELLEELKKRRIPRAIATASRKENVDFYIENFHLDRWFSPTTVIYDDGKIPGKPNPDFYLRAARGIGVPPECCIVFEDALSGIQSAFRAKIGTIIAVAPKEKWEEMRTTAGVADVIEDFYDFDRTFLK